MPPGTSEKKNFSITCIFSFTYTGPIILSVLKVSGLKTLHFFLLLFLLSPNPGFLSGKHLICPNWLLFSPNPLHLISQLSAVKRTEMWQRGTGHEMQTVHQHDNKTDFLSCTYPKKFPKSRRKEMENYSKYIQCFP